MEKGNGKEKEIVGGGGGGGEGGGGGRRIFADVVVYIFPH